MLLISVETFAIFFFDNASINDEDDDVGYDIGVFEHGGVLSWREARSSICRLVTGTEEAQEAPPAPNTKLSITHSFFELQSPDFAWKFVWTVPLREGGKNKKV